MSFNVVTAQWIAIIFILYTFMVVVLPYFVLKRFLAGRRLTHIFLICVVTGNFFYIMIVQIWGLFHITNRFVLIATTLAIPLYMAVKKRRIIWDQYFAKAWKYFLRFLKGENSFRYSLRKARRWVWGKIKLVSHPILRKIRENFVECVIFLGCCAAVLYYFCITNHFGAMASDLVVHMLWINELDEGVLFGEGIYPFGMHSLFYYIHAVFGIPTVRIVLLFCAVQTFYVFTMLLVFLKELCRFRYTPYIAYIAFIMGDYIQSGRYSRYYSTLPQEFGMIFLLPCGVALIRFFQSAKEEKDEFRRMKEQKLLYTQIQARKKWKESSLWLFILVLSFGLTFSAHFYITIVAVFVLLAIAIVYVKRLFDLKILRNLVVAAIFAILIPIIPMGVAFIGGTPLQASLYWALGVMGIEDETEEDTEASTEPSAEESVGVNEEADVYALDSDSGISETEQTLTIRQRLSNFFATVERASTEYIEGLIFKNSEDFQNWLICVVVLAVEILLMWLFREWEQSRYILFVLLYNAFMVFIGTSSYYGLPVILDENRGSIFLAYSALVCVSVAVDGVLVVMASIIRIKRFWQLVSFGLLATFVGNMVMQERVREKPEMVSALQTDGAAVCVYSIMKDYPDQKWTIVSCNEERNMVSPVSWHYEVIDFLQSMEDYQPSDEMYIPTQYVFFFIEKNVINYTLGVEFEDVDGRVSDEWASYVLPYKNALEQYTSYSRIVVNSRMYYWAQEYQKRFPNEMKVYYEDDSFVCYVIEQNEYYLNNFAIDYGYNSGGSQE